MYVITVEFQVKPEHISAFLPAMKEQAKNSLDLEEHCHHFDVCQDTNNSNRIFLYEIYSDEAAFQAHLDSTHFKTFAERVSTWVDSKSVHSLNKI